MMSMEVAQRAKDGYKARSKMPEYSPQSEDKALDYTPYPEEEVP